MSSEPPRAAAMTAAHGSSLPLLAAALERLEEGVALSDPDGHILHANLAFGRLFDGQPPSTIDAICAGKRRPPTTDELVRTHASSWTGESRLVGAVPGATRHLVRARIDCDVDAAGVPMGFTLILTDLTRQRQEDARLRFLEMAVEQSLEPVLITEAEPIDEPGPRIVYANRAFSEVTGYSLDEVRGRNPRMLQGPGTDRGTLDRIRAALSHWEPIRAELKDYRKDGSEFWVEMVIWPVADANGWYTHWVAVQRDITQKKHIEEQMQQAREAAELASLAKSRFLANMSHEIRTPLAAILGHSEILENLPGTPAENVQAISRNCRHLLQIVGSVLDLSKIEAGKFDPEWVDYCPWRLALEVAATQRLHASEKGVTLTTVATGPLPARCRMDPTLTHQVLLNLVNNAVKFTQVGGSVAVRVEAVHAQAGAGIELRYSVEDTGIGINAAQAARIFNPFEQGDNTTTRKYGGTGLGLNIASQLIELMGGAIAVQSQPGVGSRFTMTLPCQSSEPDAAWTMPPADAESEPADAPANTRTRPSAPRLQGRLLLADDNPDNRLILNYHLRPTGLEVIMAENGRQAVEQGLARSFDAILMDMQMPEVDGYCATQQLRAAGYAGPIIALTAHAMPEDRQRCLQAGCTDYLAKPVPAAGLYTMLCRYLHSAAAGS